MPKHKNEINLGVYGENVACYHIVKSGNKVLDRNVRYRCGELDIVYLDSSNSYHFVEVKTRNVIHETNSYKPEDNLTVHKLRRLSRAIQIYSLNNEIDLDVSQWYFDLFAIEVNRIIKSVRIKIYKDLPLC